MVLVICKHNSAHGKCDRHKKHGLQCHGKGQPVENRESRSSVLYLTWARSCGTCRTAWNHSKGVHSDSYAVRKYIEIFSLQNETNYYLFLQT